VSKPGPEPAVNKRTHHRTAALPDNFVRPEECELRRCRGALQIASRRFAEARLSLVFQQWHTDCVVLTVHTQGRFKSNADFDAVVWDNLSPAGSILSYSAGVIQEGTNQFLLLWDDSGKESDDNHDDLGVRVTFRPLEQVPEPTSIAIMLAGMAGLAGMRRRRRQAAK